MIFSFKSYFFPSKHSRHSLSFAFLTDAFDLWPVLCFSLRSGAFVFQLSYSIHGVHRYLGDRVAKLRCLPDLKFGSRGDQKEVNVKKEVYSFLEKKTKRIFQEGILFLDRSCISG